MFYADWPGLIPDDGLLTANQVLCGDCGACTHTSCHPHFSNVIVVSVQPERNIQLFPTGGKALTIYCCTVRMNTPRFSIHSVAHTGSSCLLCCHDYIMTCAGA